MDARISSAPSSASTSTSTSSANARIFLAAEAAMDVIKRMWREPDPKPWYFLCIVLWIIICLQDPEASRPIHPANLVHLDQFIAPSPSYANFSEPPIPEILRPYLAVMAYTLPTHISEWLIHLPMPDLTSGPSSAKILYADLAQQRRAYDLNMMWREWVTALQTGVTKANGEIGESWGEVERCLCCEGLLEGSRDEEVCDSALPIWRTYLSCIWRHHKQYDSPPTTDSIPTFCSDIESQTVHFIATLDDLVVSARDQQHLALEAVDQVARFESEYLMRTAFQPALELTDRNRFILSKRPTVLEKLDSLKPNEPGTPYQLPGDGADDDGHLNRVSARHIHGVMVPTEYAQEELEAWMAVYSQALATEMLATSMLRMALAVGDVCDHEVLRAKSAGRVNLLQQVIDKAEGRQPEPDPFSLKSYRRRIKRYLETIPLPFSRPQDHDTTDTDAPDQRSHPLFRLPYSNDYEPSNKGARTPLTTFLNYAIRNSSCEFFFDRTAPFRIPGPEPLVLDECQRLAKGSSVEAIVGREIENAVWEAWWGRGLKGVTWETVLQTESGGWKGRRSYSNARLELGSSLPITKWRPCRERLMEVREEEWREREGWTGRT